MLSCRPPQLLPPDALFLNYILPCFSFFSSQTSILVFCPNPVPVPDFKEKSLIPGIISVILATCHSSLYQFLSCRVDFTTLLPLFAHDPACFFFKSVCISRLSSETISEIHKKTLKPGTPFESNHSASQFFFAFVIRGASLVSIMSATAAGSILPLQSSAVTIRFTPCVIPNQ